MSLGNQAVGWVLLAPIQHAFSAGQSSLDRGAAPSLLIMRETNRATRFHALGFHRYDDGYGPYVFNTGGRTCLGRSSERLISIDCSKQAAQMSPNSNGAVSVKLSVVWELQ
jgi:hypothetical protein